MIPIAGDQVTNDIAVSLRTPTQYAEEIKIKYACALSQLANPDETIEVPSVGDRPPRRLARQTLAEVVEPRYEELFALVREELRRCGFEEMIAAGVVLTGGSAKMEGAIELAEEVFHMPVRLGAAAGRRAVSSTSCATRSTRPASACCCTAQSTRGAGEGAKRAQSTIRAVTATSATRMKSVVPGKFVRDRTGTAFSRQITSTVHGEQDNV